MKHTKRLGVAIVVIFALGAATAAVASAEEFIASRTGRLTGHALTPEVLTAGTTIIECTGAEYSGEVTETKMLVLSLSRRLSGCVIQGSSTAVEVGSLAMSLLTEPPLLRLENITSIGVPSALCKINIYREGNRELKGIKYKNNGGKLIVENTITKILYYVEGESYVCGRSPSGIATLEGSEEIELEGGSLEVS